MVNALIILGMILCVVAVLVSLYSWMHRRQSLDRVSLTLDAHGHAIDLKTAPRTFGLRPWLSRAGYRTPRAVWIFLGSMSLFVSLGAAAWFLMIQFGVVGWMVQSLLRIPGGVGNAFATVAYGGPWILFAMVASAPILWVRAQRRRIVQEVEQDLPLILELLATLAESGSGFDSALGKILDAQPLGRTLASEFRIYQREMTVGVPRLQGLRRLARRLEIGSVAIFVSALVQSEQIGASIANTLRLQSEELRNRRREQVMILAQALPVKLVFPLVLCFLPAIFVSTLGPTLAQLTNVVDGVLGGVGVR